MIKYPITKLYRAGYRHTDYQQIIETFAVDTVTACKICYLLAEYEETERIINEMMPNV